MRSREEIKEEYNDYYRENPSKWAGSMKLDFMMYQLRGYPEPDTMLDFGCGTGVALEKYGRVNTRTELYGIDISDEAIRLAKERVPYAHFTTENHFEEIKQFDFITCLGVAEHMESIVEFLIELKGRLKSGGFCYFKVPNNLSYSRGPSTYRRLPIGSKQIEWHLPRIKWETLLLRGGFKVVSRIKGAKAPWEFIWILR
jgi:2-polyprenyl-3-methyl-5-hydroxy-6-metoxy-1,4-benzoquinol methylase